MPDLSPIPELKLKFDDSRDLNIENNKKESIQEQLLEKAAPQEFEDNPKKGVFFMILSTFFMVLANVFNKMQFEMSPTLGVFELLFA